MSVDTAALAAHDANGASDRPAVEHARATVRPEKAAAVAELAEAFRTAGAAVLTEYRGLSVSQVTALRVALGADTTYSVVKNTLTRLAAADAGLAGLEEFLTGPTAVAFIAGEPVEAARTLRDYARANPALVVKGGVLDGKPLTADEVRRLADLESREVLLAKMAGAMKASLTQAVYLFSAPLSQVARLAAALQDKAEQDPSVLRGGADTSGPAAPEAVTDEVASHEGGTDEAPADQVAAGQAAAGQVAAGQVAAGQVSSDGAAGDSPAAGAAPEAAGDGPEAVTAPEAVAALEVATADMPEPAPLPVPDASPAGSLPAAVSVPEVVAAPEAVAALEVVTSGGPDGGTGTAPGDISGGSDSPGGDSTPGGTDSLAGGESAAGAAPA